MNTNPLFAPLQRKIETREARIAVIGLGYVGLPLVELFADAGFRVLGFDNDPKKVESLRAGRSYIGHIDSSRIAGMRDQGRFEATADFARLSEREMPVPTRWPTNSVPTCPRSQFLGNAAGARRARRATLAT